MIGGLEVESFRDRHLEGAATLLAVRHRRDRTREPDLPARFEETAAVAAVLRGVVEWSAGGGVVALRGGRVVGFLVGGVILTPPTSRHALYLPTRCAFVPFAGHAAEPEGAHDVYAELYAALAPRWVASGCFAHYAQVTSTDLVTLEAWQALGFGHELTTALRDTGPLVRMTRGSVDIRRAGSADFELTTQMVMALARYHARPPVYLPYLPEAEADEREHQRRLLGDPVCAEWLAYRGRRPLGMLCMQPPSRRTPPLVVPARCIYLLDAYTEPESRGTGAATALLAEAMRWARETGYTHCLLHFLSANIVARRFWDTAGFRPVKYRLCRRVDERVAWATGGT